MNEQQILCEIARKEIEYGCYSAKIDGVPIYSRIRRSIRKQLMKNAGVIVMELRKKADKNKSVISIAISCCHLCKLLFWPQKRDTVFMAFPRVDNVNGIYVDKFTDPLIEAGGFGEDYIIFEHGFGGVHNKPRMHSKHIVYVDCVNILSLAFAHLVYKRFCKKHDKELSVFFDTLEKAFGGEWNRKVFVKELAAQCTSTKIYYWLLRRIQPKRVIGPSRDYLKKIFIPAKELHISTYELQHGITYGETEMYSGFRDEFIIPDYFLAFGNNKPSDVYGIEENRIVNIGWAFYDLLANMPQNERYGENDILVISEPEITDAIISATLALAERNPESSFYIRTHPHEILEERHLSQIIDKNNIKIQDKNINIAVVLEAFEHVIGENSTVLYEALAAGKKVGRLFTEGLHPKYLEESDKKCFWEIRTDQDFKSFLSDDISSRDCKSIYSKFNKELFKKTIGLV